MANKTVYPYGTNGSLPSSIGIIDDCTTGGADKALSARQGAVLDGKINALAEEVNEVKSSITTNTFTLRAKNAILALLEKVAFSSSDVSDEMSELNNALFNLDEVVGISAVYTQGSSVVWSDGVTSLNSLKTDLVVKAEYGDGAEATINNYTLSGTLTPGTSTITVEYEGFTTTFSVTVTKYGSKSSYSLAEGSIENKQGATDTYTYGVYTAHAVNNYGSNSGRRVFVTNFGKQELRDKSDLVISSIYPFKIPAGATSVTATVSGTNQQISIRILYLLDNGRYVEGISGDENYPTIHSSAYITGSDTLDISSIVNRDDTYVFLHGRLSTNGNYSSEPSAITLSFE